MSAPEASVVTSQSCESCGGCGGRFDATFIEGGCSACDGTGVVPVSLRVRIAEACRKANTGLFGDGHCDDWYELADAVLADLNIKECCVVCGLSQDDCAGQDHGEYEHEYAPLLFLAIPGFLG